MANTPDAAVTPAAGRMSAFARLGNVIIDPKPAFTDIASRPGWWVPMILLMAASLAFMVAFSQRVGWERFIQQSMEASSQTQNLTAEQRETAARIGGTFGTVAAVAGVPVSMLVIAGVLVFIFGTMLGTSVNFRQVFGIVAHAWLPSLFATGAAILVMFLKDPDDFDLKNPSGFNIGFYLPHSTPAWLVSLGGSIDVFSLWIILLLATGLSVASKKSWKTSLMGVAGPWALFVAGKVLWAAVRG